MISGVVVACRPERIAATTRTLDALAGVEVHHSDARGRLVITLEAANADASAERLREIQQLPNVLMAEMAACCFEDERP